MKVVIVGGVAGGASCAARLRRLDEQADITIYERSGYISYANCGLPYYIGGVITDRRELTLQTPGSFYKRFRVNVRVRHEVTAIDTENKMVRVKNLETGEELSDSYDKLVLSTGAKAVKPDIAGADGKNVFTLRTVEDTYRIYDYIKTAGAKSAVVIGGGFVGIELAENLRHAGLEVTLTEAAPQALSIFDSDMAAQIHAALRSNGIRLILKSGVESLEGGVCRLSNGMAISADVMLLAIGVTPDTSLAKSAGLATGIKGSIIVNERMETSCPDIYAVGDAVQVRNFVTGESALISLAGPANKQGRIAADNIAGIESTYNGTQGTSVIKIFDMTAAATGINERTAKAAGIEYEKAILSPMSHAGYYPGGRVMTMKVLFERSGGKILGAQIIGSDGVDKRIDVIATAMRTGMKPAQLAELELAYAPPYSSAKDPVNMAGFIIDNVISGRVKQFYYEDVASLRTDGSVFLLDSRTPAEYAAGHVDGFVNIPVDELRDRILEVPKEKPVYVMCQSGLRSYIATQILRGLGYDAYNFAGGYRFYSIVASDKIASEQSYPCGMDR